MAGAAFKLRMKRKIGAAAAEQAEPAEGDQAPESRSGVGEPLDAEDGGVGRAGGLGEQEVDQGDRVGRVPEVVERDLIDARIRGRLAEVVEAARPAAFVGFTRPFDTIAAWFFGGFESNQSGTANVVCESTPSAW